MYVSNRKSIRTLYHVTDSESAKNIQKSGILQKGNGPNVQAVGDNPGVYFCKREEVPFWQLLLGKEIVLECQVEEPDSDFQRREYEKYGEFYIPYEIWPLTITDVTATITKEEKQRANEILCCSCLWQINVICVTWAEFYHGIRKSGDITAKNLALETKTILELLTRLDFASVPANKLTAEMQKMIDSCCYAFTDKYNNTGLRLWEQLICYKTDEWTDIRTKFHHFIRDNLRTIYNTNTGGWSAV